VPAQVVQVLIIVDQKNHRDYGAAICFFAPDRQGGGGLLTHVAVLFSNMMKCNVRLFELFESWI
jgi:hypothetical protein